MLNEELFPEVEQQKVAALNYILEAWGEAILDGLSSESVAHAALFAALSDLVTAYGEEAVAHMTKSLPERIKKGEFSLNRTVQ